MSGRPARAACLMSIVEAPNRRPRNNESQELERQSRKDRGTCRNGAVEPKKNRHRQEQSTDDKQHTLRDRVSSVARRTRPKAAASAPKSNQSKRELHAVDCQQHEKNDAHQHGP